VFRNVTSYNKYTILLLDFQTFELTYDTLLIITI